MFSLTGAVAGAWALGRFQAMRTAWVSELADRSAADVRRRIAREMHDVVAHSLAVVVSHAEAGRMVAATDPGRTPEVFATIAASGRRALTEMRGLLGVLRDDAASLTPSPGLAELPALIESVRASGQTVEYESPATLPALSPTKDLTAYRVVQEALTNVCRHAGPAATAQLTINHDDEELTIEVRDDGGPPTSGPPGRGLTGMRERVDAVGGTLDAGPIADGWRIRASLRVTASDR
jgi:signal transduction histidine kinase